MQNPYQTLGVNRDATADDIKRAYRKLASKHHPDRGGDTKVFQEIQTAYDTLSDPQRRAQFDNPMNHFGFRSESPFDFETIFNVFGTRFQQPGQNRRQMARMNLWITLRDVAQGGRRTISVGTTQGTQAVEIEIPPGIDEGDSVKYPNVGPGNMDLIVTYRIHPDAKFQRQGLNLHVDHVVNIWDLVVGRETQLKDLLGNTLSLTIPEKSQPGSMLRLRGRGLANNHGAVGDLLVRLQAKIPDQISDSLLEQIKKEKSDQ